MYFKCSSMRRKVDDRKGKKKTATAAVRPPKEKGELSQPSKAY